jgi:hypothetical protein
MAPDQAVVSKVEHGVDMCVSKVALDEESAESGVGWCWGSVCNGSRWMPIDELMDFRMCQDIRAPSVGDAGTHTFNGPLFAIEDQTRQGCSSAADSTSTRSPIQPSPLPLC